MKAFDDVSDEVVKALVEGASWNDVGVEVQRLDESSDEGSEERVDEGDGGAGFTLDSSKVGGDSGGKTPVMSGGSKDKDHSVQDGSANSEVNKSTNESEEEVHTCPLCESELDAPLSDEIITEHVQLVLEALEDSRSSEVNEEEEEADEDNSPE